MIKIEKLNKYYSGSGAGKLHVLKDITLEIPERGMVAIFGRSGCGKTTLLNCIGGLDDFSSGSITVDGRSVTEDKDLLRCAKVGYIFQNYCLNPARNCYDNVADALRLVGAEEGEEMEAAVTAALKAVDMEKYRLRMPDSLSGGQQQRIAIARALVKDPSIILADEPTGNLDEENTYMIMELLASIAEERAVVLVTHERDLVDDYCHTVVELCDGYVQSVRRNELTGERRRHSRNVIYLGDMEKTSLSSEGVEVNYYGKSDTPPTVTLVEQGGRLLIRVGGRDAVLLDSESETVLSEERRESAEPVRAAEPVKIPRVRRGRIGRLFGFLDSFLAGIRIGLGGSGKRRRLLVRTMALFAAAVVVVTAVWGTSFKSLAELDESYDHGTFYLRTDTGEVSDRLLSAVGGDSAIESVRLERGYTYGDITVSFTPGFFQSAAVDEFNLSTNVTLHSEKGMDGRLLEGRRELSRGEVLISSEMADRLIDSTTLTYITDYADLIGLRSGDSFSTVGVVEIVGVVEDGESRIYMTPGDIATYVLGVSANERISLGSRFGFDQPAGSTRLLISYFEPKNAPRVGDTVTIFGKTLTVSEVLRSDDTYDEWYANTGKGELLSLDQYVDGRIRSEAPELFDEGREEELERRRSELADLLYGEHTAYYYAEYDAFLEDSIIFFPYETSLYLWKKGIYEKARYASNVWLYLVDVYYAEHGSYPAKSQLDTSLITSYTKELESYKSRYEDVMYTDSEWSYGYYGVDGYTFALSEQDYIEASVRYGKSDEVVKQDQYELYGGADTVHASRAYYSVIRSSDPKVTAAWLAEQFPTLTADSEGYGSSYLSPDGVRAAALSEGTADIAAGIVTLAVILIFMAVCMYFIMRSSLIGRVKEIGIYRAIGVSRKNLIFRFLIESAALGTVTVLPGFILASLAVYLGLYISPLFETLMYYPAGVCLGVLVLLAAVTLGLGILPVAMLLIKTPSQILTKYDI